MVDFAFRGKGKDRNQSTFARWQFLMPLERASVPERLKENLPSTEVRQSQTYRRYVSLCPSWDNEPPSPIANEQTRSAYSHDEFLFCREGFSEGFKGAVALYGSYDRTVCYESSLYLDSPRFIRRSTFHTPCNAATSQGRKIFSCCIIQQV